MHQDLVLNTASCKRRQFRSFVGGKGFDRLDQPNCADGDQVLQIFSGVIEFFDDMDTKQRKCFVAVMSNLDEFIILHEKNVT
jgi:hypothetical protein